MITSNKHFKTITTIYLPRVDRVIPNPSWFRVEATLDNGNVVIQLGTTYPQEPQLITLLPDEAVKVIEHSQEYIPTIGSDRKFANVKII